MQICSSGKLQPSSSTLGQVAVLIMVGGGTLHTWESYRRYKGISGIRSHSVNELHNARVNWLLCCLFSVGRVLYM